MREHFSRTARQKHWQERDRQPRSTEVAEGIHNLYTTQLKSVYRTLGLISGGDRPPGWSVNGGRCQKLG